MQMTWKGTNLMIIFILFLSFKTLNQVLLDQPIHSTCQLFTWMYKIEDKVNSQPKTVLEFKPKGV